MVLVAHDNNHVGLRQSQIFVMEGFHICSGISYSIGGLFQTNKHSNERGFGCARHSNESTTQAKTE